MTCHTAAPAVDPSSAGRPYGPNGEPTRHLGYTKAF